MSEESAATAWQKRADEFHMMVGYCIAKWAEVDEALFDIFQECVGPRIQCAIIYYRITQLSQRLDVVDELVRSLLPKPEREGDHPHPEVLAWTDAKQGFQALLGVRRRIAHQPIEMQIEFGRRGIFNAPFNSQIFNSPDSVPPQTWFNIAVGQHERLRAKEAKSEPLALSDLKQHLADVTALRDRLVHYVRTARLKPDA